MRWPPWISARTHSSPSPLQRAISDATMAARNSIAFVKPRRKSHLQEHLQYDTWSSSRIRRLYRRRTRRVQHLQDALIRDLGEWLVRVGVSEVLIGDLSDVLATHWSAHVNAKIHLFWSHGRFYHRLHEVLNGEYGIWFKRSINTTLRQRVQTVAEKTSFGMAIHSTVTTVVSRAMRM